MGKTKDKTVKIRIEKSQKEEWKRYCKERGFSSLTSLIVSAVENRMGENEIREVVKFIEKQDNIFSKIENNINQVAKYANTKKFIDTKELLLFTKMLEQIAELKKEQNEMFVKIYHLIGKENGN